MLIYRRDFSSIYFKIWHHGRAMPALDFDEHFLFCLQALKREIRPKFQSRCKAASLAKGSCAGYPFSQVIKNYIGFKSERSAVSIVNGIKRIAICRIYIFGTGFRLKQSIPHSIFSGICNIQRNPWVG